MSGVPLSVSMKRLDKFMLFTCSLPDFEIIECWNKICLYSHPNISTTTFMDTLDRIEFQKWQSRSKVQGNSSSKHFNLLLLNYSFLSTLKSRKKDTKMPHILTFLHVFQATSYFSLCKKNLLNVFSGWFLGPVYLQFDWVWLWVTNGPRVFIIGKHCYNIL